MEQDRKRLRSMTCVLSFPLILVTTTGRFDVGLCIDTAVDESLEKMSLATFDRSDLEQRAQYETWLLEEVYRLTDGSLFPTWPDAGLFRPGRPPEVIAFGALNIVMGDWRPKFLEAGAPLVFVTAFKVLDAFVEWVLDCSGFQVGRKGFKEKTEALASRKTSLPIWMQDADIVDDVVAMYGPLAGWRNTVVHRSGFSQQNGVLTVRSDLHGEVDFSSVDLRLLSRTFISILKYTLEEWRVDQRRMNQLRYDLDQLAKFACAQPRGLRIPHFMRARYYTQHGTEGDVQVDEIRSYLLERYPTHEYIFDLRLVTLLDGVPHEAFLIPHEDVARIRFVKELGVLRRFSCPMPDDAVQRLL